MDLISVIIPYYKKKEYIISSINSVLNQTYKNLEIIIIYDDEVHKDLNLIKKIKNSDKRIKLIINKINLGAGKSRNLGIKQAKGEYIAFLDADDIWKRNKIEKQLDFMLKNNYEISHTSYEILNKNKKNKKLAQAKTFKDYKKLLVSCDIGLSTVLLKKDLINKNCKFSKEKTKEDFLLWLQILKRNKTIVGYNKNLTIWRKLDNSLSSSVIQKLKDGFKLYHRYLKFNYIKSLFYLLILSINSLKK